MTCQLTRKLTRKLTRQLTRKLARKLTRQLTRQLARQLAISRHKLVRLLVLIELWEPRQVEVGVAVVPTKTTHISARQQSVYFVLKWC